MARLELASTGRFRLRSYWRSRSVGCSGAAVAGGRGFNRGRRHRNGRKHLARARRPGALPVLPPGAGCSLHRRGCCCLRGDGRNLRCSRPGCCAARSASAGLCRRRGPPERVRASPQPLSPGRAFSGAGGKRSAKPHRGVATLPARLAYGGRAQESRGFGGHDLLGRARKVTGLVVDEGAESYKSHCHGNAL